MPPKAIHKSNKDNIMKDTNRTIDVLSEDPSINKELQVKDFNLKSETELEAINVTVSEQLDVIRHDKKN